VKRTASRPRRARPAPRALRELIQRVQRTRGTRARIIIDQSFGILPHYRGVSGARLAAIRRSVLHHLGLFYNVTLATGRALTAADLEPSRQVARRRAAEGVPLGEFLTFFQIGLTVIWEHLMATAGDQPALRQLLLDRVGAVISNQTQLMTALVEAYVEERERLSRFRERDLDELLSLLVSDEAPDALLEARAESLGLPLDEELAAAAFPLGSDGERDLRRRLAEALGASRLWLGRTREGFVAVLAGEPQLEPRLADAVAAADRHAGIGASGRGLASLRRSTREALRALRIGAALGGAARVHRYEDLAVLDLVRAGSPDGSAFVRRTLGPLLDGGAARSALETLRQLGAHGHRIKPAAAALGVHPHTLTYRLKQIRRRFGLDLDDAEVRLRVELALRILAAERPRPSRDARAGGRAPAERHCAGGTSRRGGVCPRSAWIAAAARVQTGRTSSRRCPCRRRSPVSLLCSRSRSFR
jgi:hypothetical protein